MISAAAEGPPEVIIALRGNGPKDISQAEFWFCAAVPPCSCMSAEEYDVFSDAFFVFFGIFTF
jgi:hypothetical protein